jgi:hypothetical protein
LELSLDQSEFQFTTSNSFDLASFELGAFVGLAYPFGEPNNVLKDRNNNEQANGVKNDQTYLVDDLLVCLLIKIFLFF